MNMYITFLTASNSSDFYDLWLYIRVFIQSGNNVNPVKIKLCFFITPSSTRIHHISKPPNGFRLLTLGVTRPTLPLPRRYQATLAARSRRMRRKPVPGPVRNYTTPGSLYVPSFRTKTFFRGVDAPIGSHRPRRTIFLRRHRPNLHGVSFLRQRHMSLPSCVRLNSFFHPLKRPGKDGWVYCRRLVGYNVADIDWIPFRCGCQGDILLVWYHHDSCMSCQDPHWYVCTP